MDETPDFTKKSKAELRWIIEQYPSPHRFFKPAMAALAQKEDEDAAMAEESLFTSKRSLRWGIYAVIIGIIALIIGIVSLLLPFLSSGG